MATNTVENPTKRGLGSSDTASLAEQFPATPNDFIPSDFIYSFLDGIISDNPMLGSFDMDYGLAPDLEDPVIQNDIGIVGLVPNPTPPGPGDVNPANKPPPPSDYPPQSSGFGSSTSPSSTSGKIAQQRFDLLIPGKSSAD